MNDIVWTNDATGRMTGEQVGWRSFTGQEEAGDRGLGWTDAIPPEDAQPTTDAWTEAVAASRPFVFEHRVRRHDGEWRLCSVRAVAVVDEQGAIAEWVGVHTDITAMKRAEAVLRESNERQRFLLTLANALRPLSSPADVQDEACRILGTHLRVNGVAYFEIRGGDFVASRSSSISSMT